MINTFFPQVMTVPKTHPVLAGQARTAAPGVHQPAAPGHTTSSAMQVDILLTWRGRVGLFKKSGHCSTEGTPWQLPSLARAGSHTDPDEEFLQCIQLLHAETGLAVRDILTIQAGPTVELSHGSQNTVHRVYLVETDRRRLALGSGYSVYRWVKQPRIGRFDGGAEWLGPVLEAAVPRPPKSHKLMHSTAGSRAALAA